MLPESFLCCFFYLLVFHSPHNCWKFGSTSEESVLLRTLLVSSWLANTWDLIAWNICDSADFLLCETELSLGYHDTWLSVWPVLLGLCRSFCLIRCSSPGLFLVHCLLAVDFLCTIEYICVFAFDNFKSAFPTRPFPGFRLNRYFTWCPAVQTRLIIPLQHSSLMLFILSLKSTTILSPIISLNSFIISHLLCAVTFFYKLKVYWYTKQTQSSGRACISRALVAGLIIKLT